MKLSDTIEGMLIRTELGIGKIVEISEKFIVIQFSRYTKITVEIDIIKKVPVSFNIVDLIKKDDILLGRDGKKYQCWKIYKGYVFTYSKNKEGQTITLVDYQIDRVLTKEQFEIMAYKVGD